jgi:hypothetical protein
MGSKLHSTMPTIRLRSEWLPRMWGDWNEWGGRLNILTGYRLIRTHMGWDAAHVIGPNWHVHESGWKHIVEVCSWPLRKERQGGSRRSKKRKWTGGQCVKERSCPYTTIVLTSLWSHYPCTSTSIYSILSTYIVLEGACCDYLTFGSGAGEERGIRRHTGGLEGLRGVWGEARSWGARDWTNSQIETRGDWG